jgi:hypothetical protein
MSKGCCRLMREAEVGLEGRKQGGSEGPRGLARPRAAAPEGIAWSQADADQNLAVVQHRSRDMKESKRRRGQGRQSTMAAAGRGMRRRGV